MYHRERRKMKYLFIFASLILVQSAICKSIEITGVPVGPTDDDLDNNIIDFDEDYTIKFNKKYGSVPWHTNDKFNKDTHKYTVVKENTLSTYDKSPKEIVEDTTPSENLGVIPLELISTTENALLSIIESTTAVDLTVIPLSNTKRTVPFIEIAQTVTLPSSTQSTETSTDSFYITTENDDKAITISENSETTTTKRDVAIQLKEIEALNKEIEQKTQVKFEVESTSITTDVAVTKTLEFKFEPKNITDNSASVSIPEKETTVSKTETKINETNSKKIQTIANIQNSSKIDLMISTPNKTTVDEENYKTKENKSNIITASNKSSVDEIFTTNSKIETEINSDWEIDSKEDVIPYTGLDSEEVPEDYYDAKDVVPTTAPKTDALSVIFGLAGSMVESVVESVAERVVPKGIYDLFKRMQKQSEALEAERLRSREENGGLGQFGRGILKSISTGLSKPLSQLMAGVKDIGSLDSDRGFVSSLASGVTSVASAANSLADMFKDRVQAIYPGTVWCGDGHSAQARSNSELGLFFFTDTCCRQHDACKIYIKSGETKYGLTNTGLFTRSHCSCDVKFKECLRKTNSLVSAQIGLTYFNVLGPQCFRKAHPIVKCVKKTRITGQKCEEYELDYTKPKMWQWFDNETF